MTSQPKTTSKPGNGCTPPLAPATTSTAGKSTLTLSQKSTLEPQRTRKSFITSENTSPTPAAQFKPSAKKSEPVADFFYPGTVGLVNRMDERATLQRLAKEVEGLRARHTQIGGQLEQVDAVLSEHTVTEAVLKALVQQPTAETTTHVSIGSGVSLPYKAGSTEGTALIDLGSNIFGERPWSGIPCSCKPRIASRAGAQL